MSGITGMGTTFNLPNYHGELFALTPKDTPLLSMIGGLTGGGMASSVEFEWQASDLRSPGQNVQVEGAPAPTGVARVRQNVRNVVEIHQSKVSLSYTKQSTPGMAASPSSAPYRVDDGVNPITNELDWQLGEELASIALDVNWTFYNGIWQNPTDNTTPRKTRGLVQAIATNRTDKSGEVHLAASSATDTITPAEAHALSVNDKIVFTNAGSTPLIAGRVYFVKSVSTTVSFKVAATLGGATITLGTSTANIDVHKPQTAALAVADINTFVQGIYDNGGLTGTPVLAVNSTQKTAITKAYATAYAQSRLILPGERIGGVAVDSALTDFGTFGIMLDRHVPQDTILALTVDQLKPVFLNVEGKGVFFEEPLAKTGASDDVQIYGEVGLAYGNERAHGSLTGLAV